MAHILENLELSDLATINRVLRKRGLTAKMVDTDHDAIWLRVNALPEQEMPLLKAEAEMSQGD